MRSSRGTWGVFVLLGIALYLSSVGFWSHPIYRMVLVLAFFIWSGYVMWTPHHSITTTSYAFKRGSVKTR